LIARCDRILHEDAAMAKNNKNKKLTTTKKPVPSKNSRAKKKTPAPKKAGARQVRPRAAVAGPSAKQQYLDVFNKEHATTLKVIRAFPADQGAFQPHPRSSSARKLVWAFAVEQGVVGAVVDGTWTMPPSLPPEPATLAEAITSYEAGVKSVAAKVAKMRDARLHATVPFFTGPHQTGDVPVIDIMWLMLMDSIHHRGQLSVYIRMAGGKVPSIYGPSADEPWM
jgi:uncharacterized damage-inducible protein DinB